MEYADEYTKKEKVVRFSVFTILGLAVIAFHKFLFLPLVTDFVERPHCYEFLGGKWCRLCVAFSVCWFAIFSFCRACVYASDRDKGGEGRAFFSKINESV